MHAQAQPKWTRLPLRTRPHRNPLADNDDAHPVDPLAFAAHCAVVYRDMGSGATQPQFVDVGCAFGGMLLALAPLFPQTCMLGLEIRSKVVAFAQQRVLRLRDEAAAAVECDANATAVAVSHAAGVDDNNSSSSRRHHYNNVWFEQLNVMKFGSNCFGKAQLRCLFFCYPDPHWKRKNVRRRIIAPGLLHEYAYWLAPGGLLYTVSDVAELQAWMCACLDACPLFRRVCEADELASELEQRVLRIVTDASEDAQRTQRRGLQKHYAVYARV